MIKLTFVVFLLFTLNPVLLASSGQSKNPDSKELVLEMKNMIEETLLEIAKIERKAGRDLSDFYYLLNLPVQYETNLGFILDTDSTDKGYPILSITPGGIAEKKHLEVGDKIIVINDIPVNNNNRQLAFSQLQVLLPGDNLDLVIDRGGKTKLINILIQGNLIPGIKLEIGTQKNITADKLDVKSDSSCGEVSVFFRPPMGKGLYRANIRKIDGKNINFERHTVQLPPGKHLIEIHGLMAPNSTGRAKRLNHESLKRYNSEILIDIEAGKSYDLASKFISLESKEESKQFLSEAVIWKISDKSCQL